MIALYITSNEPYSGKTLTALVLGKRWLSQGRRVGFFKPLGLLPVTVDDQVTDEDALFVAQQLEIKTPPSQLCPIILSPAACHVEREGLRRRVKEAFSASAAGHDIMLVGGLGSVFSRGSTFGLDALWVAEAFDAKVLLVAHSESFLAVDGIFAARKLLGERMIGVILNRVSVRHKQVIEREVLPCLRELGVVVLGLLPNDPLLSSVSVKEILEATGGELLSQGGLDEELIENFVVGAMGVDSALRHFRHTPRKCVITGGDRSDIQLAALETSTRCLILTGHLLPDHKVVARAQELGVPMILVREDTLATVTKVEELLGKQRVRQPRKIDHALKQFEAHLDLAKLDGSLGLT